MIVFKTKDALITMGAGQRLVTVHANEGQWQLVIHPGRVVLLTASKYVVHTVFGLIGDWIDEKSNDGHPVFFFDIEALARLAAVRNKRRATEGGKV